MAANTEDPAAAGDTGDAALREAAHRLYGLPLGEFTAARNGRAKAARKAGDRRLGEAIARLPKPTTAAWLVNLLVRRQAEQVGDILLLGAQLREAQAELDAQQLRALDRRKRQLTAAVTQQARDLAADLGQRVSDQVAGQVEQTLQAAMADAGAASAVSTGMLVDSLESTGLEPVDLGGAVAVPSAAAAEAPAPAAARHDAEREAEAARVREEAGAALEVARQALRDARETAERARGDAEAAGGRRADLEAERDALQERLRQLEEDLARATGEERAAEGALSTAEREESRAGRRLEKAQARLDQLG